MNQNVTHDLIVKALEAARCYDSRSTLVKELEEWLRQFASQPEAPCFRRWCNPGNLCIDCQPEAPKGPAAEALDSVATKMLDLQDRIEAYPLRVERDLAAANARIAELNQLLNNATHLAQNEREARDAANARADAAEREVAHLSGQVAFERDSYAALKTERDQLAARVTELQAHEENARKLLVANVERLTVALTNQCTPEERKVLEESKELQIVTRGTTAYVPPEATADLGRLLHAELANRAAKAKLSPAANEPT